MNGSVNSNPFDGHFIFWVDGPQSTDFATSQPTKRPDANAKPGGGIREGSVFAEALAWPVNMGARQCASPLFIAAVTAFFVIPYAYPEVGRGAAVLIGYGAGVGTYVARFAGDGPLPKT